MPRLREYSTKPSILLLMASTPLATVAIALFIPLGFLVNDYFGLMPIFEKPEILVASLLLSGAVAALVQLFYKRVAGVFLRLFKRRKTA